MIHKRFEELRYCGTLPSSSGVGLAILRLTQTDETPAHELAQILRADPALAGKALRLANIARGPSGAPIGSIEKAVGVLGSSAMRSSALSFSLLPAGRAGACGRFDHDAYWSHAIASALAAEAIAKDRPDVDPGEAFTCALIARIGMLALATVHAGAYDHVLAEARGCSPEQLLAAEQREFDIQHWEVSAAMFTEWGLPYTFSGAVIALGVAKRESDLEDPTCEPLAQVLRESSLVARRLLDGVNARGAMRDGWLDLLAPVGGAPVGRERLVSLCARIAPAWRALCGRLRLPMAEPSEEDLQAEMRAHEAAPLEPRVEFTESVEDRESLTDLSPDEVCVLAVDDDPRILRLLEHHLTSGGYRVITAPDGESALRLLYEHEPQILVTDWLMPTMSGGELLQALRKTEVGRHVYGLVLTASDAEDQVVEAFEAGADDFVAKPYNPRVLMARMAAAHRLVELQRQVRADRERRCQQVAEMGLMTRKLHAAAQTDVLTELPNRRYAIRRLEEEWTDAMRLKRPLSLLVADIDNFKDINDRHGHDVGDVVLRSTAAVLRAATRRGDVVCRLGGEEFLVINVNSGEYGAGMCAERLRTAVESNIVKTRTFEGRVTISIGLATLNSRFTSAYALLKAADEAVYAAKADGRNVVRSSPRRRSDTA